MTSVFAAWSDARWPDLKPSTVAEYGRALEHFSVAFGSVDVSELTRGHVELAMDACAKGSRSSYFSAIAACLNWASAHGWPGINGVLPERRPRSRPRNFAFDDLQWQAFWRAIKSARVCPGQYRPIAFPQTIDAIVVAATTAMRLGELVSLTWDEVSLRDRVARLYDTKTGDRTVLLSPIAMAIIERQHRNNRFVWGRPGTAWRLGDKGVSNAYRRIMTRLGEDGLGHQQNCFHSLRHSWVSTALRHGMPMWVVQKQTGHSSEHMLRRYGHVFDADLRRVVDEVEKRIVGATRLEEVLGL